MALEITLSHDPQDLYALKTTWMALQAESETDSLFATWTWLTHWWEHHKDGHQLWLLTATDKGTQKIVAIAPLMLSHHREARGVYWEQLEFLSASAPMDHWDFIIAPGYAPEVLPLFIERITQAQGWDVLALGNMLPSSPNIDTLRYMPIPWVEISGHPTPYLPLTDNFDDLFAKLTSNKRRKQRKYMKTLAETHGDNWSFGLERGEAVEPVLRTLMQHHQAHWQALNEPGAFPDATTQAEYIALAQAFDANDWLRLFHLQFAGETAAVLLAFGYRERVYHFATGVNYEMSQLNPGHILSEQVLRWCCENGVQEYDFMWGDEAYKFEWGAKNRVDRTLTWYRTTRGQLAHSVVEIARAGKQKLREMRARQDNTDAE